jgi:hypothetical protein
VVDIRDSKNTKEKKSGKELGKQERGESSSTST